MDKHRLRVFDVAHGNVAGEYVLQASFGTCLQWAKISNGDGGRASSPSKKRKRAAQEPNASQTISVVMLGLANGTLTFFSPARGTTVLTLAHPSSTAAILAADMDSDDSHVWTSNADGSIHLWNLHSNTIEGAWKSPSKLPYSKLCLIPQTSSESDEARHVLAANHSIDLLAVSPGDATPNSLAKFSGHVTNVTSMTWLSSSSLQRFITSAERDRFLQGWTIPSSGTEGKLSFSASVDGDIRKVQATSDGSIFLVVSSTGTICLFAPPSGSSANASKPLEPLSVINFSVSKSKNVTDVYDVIDATFASPTEGAIQVARLTEGARIAFQSVRFTDHNQELIPRVNVKNAVLTKAPFEDLPSTRRYKEADNLNISSGIIAAQDDTTNGADIEVENGALDTEMAELSLGQRLRATQRGEDGQISSSDSDSDPQATKKGKKGREVDTIEVPTESLSRTLTQALHSSDAKLLEGCLRHSDPTIIQNTVMRLPPQLAVPLLQACVERLARGRGGNTGRPRGSAASAQRGTVMIAWIKVVLVVHSGHIMTMPNLVSRLASLHSTLSTRLALHERLLLLNGRLDLALSQVELRSASKQGKSTSRKPKPGDDKDKTVSRYVEGDSSDDQEMDVDAVEASEEGDIEDIGLGGRSNLQSDSDDEGSDEEGSDEEDEESGSEEIEDDDFDDDDSDDGPRLNGLIDDEAEESWGSEEEEEDEEE